MTQFCKIGFHGGLGGNHMGIGEYMRRLDEAKVPFYVKSVNNVGLVVEAAQHARASGVPHNIVMRWSNPGVPHGPEVPEYRKHPEEAAQEHWELVQQSLNAAPEFDEFKDLVWIETINEPRTMHDAGDPNFEGMHPTDWLGWFAHYFGQLIAGSGYRWAAWGMNAGTPEPEDWKLDGMVRYLKDCEANPEKLAVALHEYSFQLDTGMKPHYPHLLGRFEHLYATCDELGISRPTTLITETGWTFDNMPGDHQAMEDIRWMAKLYGSYPTILGAHLWTLEGPSKLPNKLQRQIVPLTEYTLTARFEEAPSLPPLPEKPEQPETVEVPEGPEAVEPPEEVVEVSVPSARGKPRVEYDRTYVLLHPDADSGWAKAVVAATWDQYGFTLGKSPDDAGIGDLKNRVVIAINPADWGAGEDGTGLSGFFAKYYPGVELQTVEASNPIELRQRLTAHLS